MAANCSGVSAIHSGLPRPLRIEALMRAAVQPPRIATSGTPIARASKPVVALLQGVVSRATSSRL